MDQQRPTGPNLVWQCWLGPAPIPESCVVMEEGQYHTVYSTLYIDVDLYIHKCWPNQGRQCDLGS